MSSCRSYHSRFALYAYRGRQGASIWFECFVSLPLWLTVLLFPQFIMARAVVKVYLLYQEDNGSSRQDKYHLERLALLSIV